MEKPKKMDTRAKGLQLVIRAYLVTMGLNCLGTHRPACVTHRLCQTLTVNFCRWQSLGLFVFPCLNTVFRKSQKIIGGCQFCNSLFG